MNKKKDDNRMSVKELAEFIGVSADTIRRHSGKVRFRQFS